MQDPAIQHSRVYGGAVEAYAEKNADRSFAEPLLDRVSSYLGPGQVVADLGCGPGWESGALERRGLRAVGLDVTREFLVYARDAHPVSGYVLGQFLSLPFREAALDGAWACSSLLHVPWEAIDEALSEVARVIRPGGVFFASMQAGNVQGPVPSQSITGEDLHYAYYEPEDWGARLEGAGFSIAWLNYHERGAEHCNAGARGWIETIGARQ